MKKKYEVKIKIDRKSKTENKENRGFVIPAIKSEDIG